MTECTCAWCNEKLNEEAYLVPLYKCELLVNYVLICCCCHDFWRDCH